MLISNLHLQMCALPSRPNFFSNDKIRHTMGSYLLNKKFAGSSPYYGGGADVPGCPENASDMESC